ncbi:hypothetical protein [Streptomyces sp. NPDC006527]|uniref:hypothetical protein n=1 Tax=Streptomyces sp. NPDC006527 TaxID=3364749 RepID=UPI00369722FE
MRYGLLYLSAGLGNGAPAAVTFGLVAGAAAAATLRVAAGLAAEPAEATAFVQEPDRP